MPTWNRSFAALFLAFSCSPIFAQDIVDSRSFEELCRQPGVLKCNGFDSGTDITPHLLGSTRITLDTSVKASGQGSMRFEIPSNSGPNSSGHWSDDLGDSFGQGDRFYVFFRQRFSQSMLATDFGGDGWKQVLFHEEGASCSETELTTQNIYHEGYPQLYTDCGGQRLRNHTNVRYRADDWMGFYYEVEIGTWGQPNSSIRAYAGYQGEALRQYVSTSTYRLNSSGGKRFDLIRLTTYNTDKPGGSHPVAHTWYDELIISREPIFGDAVAAPNPPQQLSAQ